MPERLRGFTTRRYINPRYLYLYHKNYYYYTVYPDCCYRDDAELQPTFKQKMAQSGDVCTLTVAGVTTKMSGTYRCVASNVAGTAECSAVVSVVGKQRVLECLYTFAA